MSLRPALCALMITACSVPAARAQDAPPTTQAPATQEAEKTLAQQREEDYQELQNEVRFYPQKVIDSYADALTLQLREDDLQLITSIGNTSNEIRLIDEDRPRSVARIFVVGSDGRSPKNEPVQFRFSEFDYTDIDTKLVNREVSYTPGNLTVARVTESDGKFENVQLKQSGIYLLEEDNDGEKVKLFVQVIDDADPDAGVDFVLAARDFVSLRQKYPKEVSQYLEPIFRELGQSSVLYHVDPQAAWQVLARGFEPSTETQAQVEEIVKRLDADEPRERAKASKELESLGQPAALTLLKWDRSSLSAEQTNRIDTFLASFKPLSDAEARRLASDPEFLSLTLTADDPRLRQLALNALKETTGETIEFDVNADAADRFEAAAKLRERFAQHSTQPATAESAKPALPPELRDARP